MAEPRRQRLVHHQQAAGLDDPRRLAQRRGIVDQVVERAVEQHAAALPVRNGRNSPSAMQPARPADGRLATARDRSQPSSTRRCGRARRNRPGVPLAAADLDDRAVGRVVEQGEQSLPLLVHGERSRAVVRYVEHLRADVVLPFLLEPR